MPWFSVDALTFMKHYGAVFVSVNIRGGSEFGEDWHLAGIREKKVSYLLLSIRYSTDS